jgi:transmembrane sensor
MTGNSERVRQLITEEAADWFVANRADQTAKQRQKFAAWLKTSPVHVEEYLALSAIASDLRTACKVLQVELDELLTRARHEDEPPAHPFRQRLIPEVTRAGARAWRTAAVAAMLCAVGASLLALWEMKLVAPVPTPAAAPPVALHFETRHGEQMTRQLADDSVLHLNTDSAVTIRYGSKERLVVLEAGEADFEVAHQPVRPFRVSAGSAEIIDVGTQFDVRLGHDSTTVTVLEGQVVVGTTPMPLGRLIDLRGGLPPHWVRVGRNQQITVASGEAPARAAAVDAQHTAAWLHRQITFEHEPLERVASEFNRYTPKPIEIVTPALRKLEISGVFATDDPAAFIAFLRSLDGVHVEETSTQYRVSRDLR